MKMRYFYRVDQKKEPIPGSNVRRKSKPSGKEWREIRNICCVSQVIDCTCGPRFFLKLDTNNNPVDYSIIKRFDRITPEEGLKYMELPSSKNECCNNINWDLQLTGTSGALKIYQSGILKVNSIVSGSSGFYKPVDGTTITVTLTNDCTDTAENSLSTVIDGVSTGNTTTPVATRTFVFDKTKKYDIIAIATCTP